MKNWKSVWVIKMRKGIIKIKVGYVDNSDEWEELIEVPDFVEDLQEYFENMIKEYNEVETDRYGEKARLRKLIKVMDKTDEVDYCDFFKMTLITEKDRTGYYDLMKCKNCGFEYKRRELRHKKRRCFPERTCEECNKTFATIKNYKRHMEKYHYE